MKRDKWFREDNLVRILYPEVLLQHMLDETPNQIRKTVAWSHIQYKMMRWVHVMYHFLATATFPDPPIRKLF